MIKFNCKRKTNSKPIALWKSLLINLLILMIILALSILFITISSGRSIANRLSNTIISQTIDQVESQMRIFFEPALSELALISDWIESGVIDPTCQADAGKLLNTVAGPVDQITGLQIATEDCDFSMNREGNQLICKSMPSPQPPLPAPPLPRRARAQRLYSTFQTLVQSNSTYDSYYDLFWADTRPLQQGKNRVFTAFKKITTPQGQSGYAAIDISFRKMSEYAQNIEVSQNGDMIILSNRHTVLAMTHNGYIGRRLKDSLPGTIDEQDSDIVTMREAWREFMEKRGADDISRPIIRFKSNNRYWWSTVDLWHIGEAKEMAIVIVIPESDLIGDIATHRNWILLTLIVVISLGIIKAVFIARNYSKPIETLVRQSNRISRGDLDSFEPVGHCNINEIYQLSQAHERMRKSLKTLMRLEGELQLAYQIQQNTIPESLPQINDFELAAWTKPAEKTGGDIYDIFGFNQDEFGNVQLNSEASSKAMLLLADASGHGIGPALTVTQLRAMMRMAARLTWDIEHIAQHINEQLTVDLPDGRFITAWMAEIDNTKQQISWFSAGQAPLYFYEANQNELIQFNSDTVPFGLVKSLPDIQLHHKTMSPGDMMIVISDGIFEAFNDQQEQFGLERVRHLISHNVSLSANDILNEIRTQTENFMAKTPARDDRTILVIKKS